MNLEMDVVANQRFHPLDWLESMFCENQWFFERPHENQLLTSMQGKSADYHMLFLWQHNAKLLNLSCCLDVKYVETRKNQLYELLARINEKIWLGHFEIDSTTGTILWRYGLSLPYENASFHEQIKEVIDTALAECERYYSTFQYVIWGNLKPEEAVTMASFETVGVA